MIDALIADDVSVRRVGRAVVEKVSLRAAYGSVTALIGPNGAGKSTLLRALIGILPYEGSVRVAGREVRGMAPRERAREVAYVPQQSLLNANIRVREVVAQGRFAHAGGWGRSAARSDARVVLALSEAEVSHLAERAFSKLSGGEQRRVLLARALATEARVLLLDEPTAGLDVAQVLRFHALMRALAERGLAVVSVLHDLLDVHQYADQAVLLAQGKLQLAGAAQQVVRSQVAERVYGVRMSADAAVPFQLVEASP
jgi:iron complex transport system ATP-binding protein